LRFKIHNGLEASGLCVILLEFAAHQVDAKTQVNSISSGNKTSLAEEIGEGQYAAVSLAEEEEGEESDEEGEKEEEEVTTIL